MTTMHSGTKGTECEQPSNTSRLRSRAWFFTWNNPVKDYDKLLINYFDSALKIKYAFQLECGKNGTLHVQGCCRFSNAVGTKFQKDLPKQIHWERCRSWKRAVDYCTKEETRVKGPWSNVIEKIDVNKKKDEVKKSMEILENYLENESKDHFENRSKLYNEIQPLRGTDEYKNAFKVYRDKINALSLEYLKTLKVLSEKHDKLKKELQ